VSRVEDGAVGDDGAPSVLLHGRLGDPHGMRCLSYVPEELLVIHGLFLPSGGSLTNLQAAEPFHSW